MHKHGKGNEPAEANKARQWQTCLRSDLEQSVVRSIVNPVHRDVIASIGWKSPRKCSQPCAEPRVIHYHSQGRAIEGKTGIVDKTLFAKPRNDVTGKELKRQQCDTAASCGRE